MPLIFPFPPPPQNGDSSDDSDNETPSVPEKSRNGNALKSDCTSEKENSFQQTFSQVEKTRLNRIEKFEEEEKLNNSSKRRRSLSTSDNIKNEPIATEKLPSVKVGKKHKSKKSKDIFESKVFKNKKGKYFLQVHNSSKGYIFNCIVALVLDCYVFIYLLKTNLLEMF